MTIFSPLIQKLNILLSYIKLNFVSHKSFRIKKFLSKYFLMEACDFWPRGKKWASHICVSFETCLLILIKLNPYQESNSPDHFKYPEKNTYLFYLLKKRLNFGIKRLFLNQNGRFTMTQSIYVYLLQWKQVRNSLFRNYGKPLALEASFGLLHMSWLL